MKLDLATDQQLMNIVNYDKECPNNLLLQVTEEMLKRKLWHDIIFYSAKLVYRHVNKVLNTILFMDRNDLYQIGHIEIFKAVENFKQGKRTFKTFVIMVLKMKFAKLIRDANAQMRQTDFNKIYIENMDDKEQDRYFNSQFNVEKYVINKMFIQEQLTKLRDVEIKAIQLELQGYGQYEISERLGFSKTYANVLLKRAYQKLRVNSA